MRLRNTSLLLAGLAVVAMAVSGCGRKGDLDRPGSSQPINTRAAPDTVEKKDEAQGRPFLLDPLL